MSKFPFGFDAILLSKMCLSIGVWMPTKIRLYTCYIPFLNDQSFHQWRKSCKSKLKSKIGFHIKCVPVTQLHVTTCTITCFLFLPWTVERFLYIVALDLCFKLNLFNWLFFIYSYKLLYDSLQYNTQNILGLMGT